MHFTVHRRHWRELGLAGIGFMLSPLSWWNDLIINVPLAYLFALPFTLISEQLFLPTFLCGYWLSNLLGLLLLHRAGSALIQGKSKSVNWRHSLWISLAYSILIVTLVLLGWIKPPVVADSWQLSLSYVDVNGYSGVGGSGIVKSVHVLHPAR